MRATILAILGIIFTSSLLGQVVDITAYGATPDQPGDDDKGAILNAIEACRGLENPVLFSRWGNITSTLRIKQVPIST
ncbi:hypothetical protein SAMN04488029_1175 [Reichenbachiella faecimaris]|uniref:Pectate lyase superfamily protein n=1 Tax=Reichenbachiella faecimaris TaxID=692418 RepID=A0A1W2G812_REIFA|nr:hypothetical protein SAMN04488029_1175 [Reichenbachiella faecimaris]